MKGRCFHKPLRNKNIDYKVDTLLYDIKAPLKKNDVIGKLILSYEENKFEYNLIVRGGVEKASLFDVFEIVLRNILSGYE